LAQEVVEGVVDEFGDALPGLDLDITYKSLSRRGWGGTSMLFAARPLSGFTWPMLPVAG